MNKRGNKSLYESVDEFGLDPASYESYDDYLIDKAELMVNDMFGDLDYEQKQELINGLLDQDEDEWEDWCMDMYTKYGVTNKRANRNESVRNYLGRRHLITEGKSLTPEEKMDRWHNGTCKENIKACNIDKLKEYRKICRAKGYAEQVKLINAELKRRKDEGINESEDPFKVEPTPGEAGRFLAKRILDNTFYAITDNKQRQSCLNNYKKVFLSGETRELKAFILEIQSRLIKIKNELKQETNNW